MFLLLINNNTQREPNCYADGLTDYLSISVAEFVRLPEEPLPMKLVIINRWMVYVGCLVAISLENYVNLIPTVQVLHVNGLRQGVVILCVNFVNS